MFVFDDGAYLDQGSSPDPVFAQLRAVAHQIPTVRNRITAQLMQEVGGGRGVVRTADIDRRPEQQGFNRTAGLGMSLRRTLRTIAGMGFIAYRDIRHRIAHA